MAAVLFYVFQIATDNQVWPAACTYGVDLDLVVCLFDRLRVKQIITTIGSG